MKLNTFRSGLILASLTPCNAFAQNTDGDPLKTSLTVAAETQELSQNFGSLRTAKIEFKDVLGDTTVVAGPSFGQRRTDSGNVTSLGGGFQIFHDWGKKVSTRTAIFVSENKPVYAKIDVAQDVTASIGHTLALTAGVRWAEYNGGQKVLFMSGGARQYFRGGSVAYRMTYTKPNTRGGYLAHLVNLSINDIRGRGKTQLWVSTGNSSIERSQLETSFSGDDYGALMRRVQPLGRNLDLLMTAGVSSYARPVNRIWGKTVGLGLSFGL